MTNTRIELALEIDSGLTENAIKEQFCEQYGDDLKEIDVIKQ